ncbi:MAG TPA: DUF4333 domain-containing protein [Coleofasciculaceae cyanobacterium]|jgi:hypothetical protein
MRNCLKMAIAPPFRWFLPACLLPLAGCNSLDVQSLAANIKTQLQAQSQLQIKSVTCPQGISKQAGASFQCEGTLEPEGTFVIQVEQTDESGLTRWEVPNSKGMLNLALLETELKQEIAKDTQAEPAVRCGSDRYRVNRPGDSFDCQVKNATLAKAKGLIEKVSVTIDPEGNLAWQQVRLVQPVAAPAGLTASPTVGEGTASPQPSAARPRVSNADD